MNSEDLVYLDKSCTNCNVVLSVFASFAIEGERSAVEDREDTRVEDANLLLFTTRRELADRGRISGSISSSREKPREIEKRWIAVSAINTTGM